MGSLTENYEIIREIGRGGMGVVLLANDKRLRRQVAIKLLKTPGGIDQLLLENLVDNFKREAVAIANLSHNNIVCVYDIGQQDDLNYFVMELIDGEPISNILKKRKEPFSLEKVLSIADEACDALAYVHANKVIHRDIKPDNFIYTTKNITKLTDFGIAKFEGEEKLHVKDEPGTIKGTIMYISPEQLNNPNQVDGRADMYSLSVSLYQMLTGVMPFDGQSPRELIMKIIKDEPVPPSKINPELLPHLDNVILKAMEKDPDKRYEDIQEFKDELGNIRDFRQKFFIQPIKGLNKKEKIYYTGISFDDFEQVAKKAEIFPHEAQQRLLYELEILFSKYYEEYKALIKGESEFEGGALTGLSESTKEVNTKQEEVVNEVSSEGIFSIDDLERVSAEAVKKPVTNFNPSSSVFNEKEKSNSKNDSEQEVGKLYSAKSALEKTVINPILPEVNEKPVVISISNSRPVIKIPEIGLAKNFKFMIPKLAEDGAKAIKSGSEAEEIVYFLRKINSTNSFMKIIEDHYSPDQSGKLLGMLFNCSQKKYVVVESTIKTDEPALLGELMLAVGLVTKNHIEEAIKLKKINEEKGLTDQLLGDIMIASGHLTRENLIYALKLQHWFRRIFS